MKSKIWDAAIKASADPARARHALKLLEETPAAPLLVKISPGQARALAALLSGSEFASASLAAHPEWLSMLLDVGQGQEHLRRKAGLRAEVQKFSSPDAAADASSAFDKLREFKQREMLRIAARDLAEPGHAPEIIEAISDVADVCLDAVWAVCWRQLVKKIGGSPWHKDPDGNWHPTTGCLLGMGKLGGQELNYSSDIDVLFVYADEGAVFRERPGAKTAARPVMPNHQFFKALAEACVAELTRLTPHGTLYRIDLRLRPEGDTGPLARSLAAYENYYAQWGQTWERMMLIKARGVAGDVALAGEFLEMVQPFRYPRSMSAGVPREVAEMKERIENEVVRRGDLEWNVKLGRGGIREVEFAAQCLQLLHAGRQPFLQGARTLPCLEKLLQYELISSAEAKALSEAYCFLRDVEHRLQMDNNLQTHTIPEDRLSRERLGRLMGFTGWNSFNAAYSSHRKKVRAIFDRILKADPASGPSTPSLPRGFDGTEARWKEILAAHGFRDAEAACRVLREFVEGPGFLHVSPRTAQLAAGLIPRFLALCPQVAPGKAAVPAASPPRPENDAPPRAARLPSSTGAPLSDPDRVLTRLDSFIAAYGARATLFELWNSNPAIFELLILVFDRSEFLAELAIRTPDLLDELVTSDRLRQRKSARETLADLRHGLSDADQHLWLRRYQQAELMRIGCRDILGLADEDQYLSELSALAEACLRYALEAVLRKHRIARAPFAVIGLGKFGGAEIDYGSDLDIVFVAGNAARNLPRLAQLAREIMDLLSRRTEQGVVFETDARLRPDGDKGLLVNTLAAYEDYYRQRALLWEIQSLTRARLIAGDESNGAEFEALAARLANFQRPDLPLSAWSEDWKKTIREMRARIERERTPAGKDALAIKTGKGGLVDAEFLAQALCLEHGWREPNTQRALERARETRQIKTAGALIDSYQRLRRLEGILRRWSYEGETVLPDAPEPYHRVAVRCGFKDSNAFQNEIASWRKRIRVSYSDYFGLSE